MGGKYVIINNNFEDEDLVKAQDQLNVAIVHDQSKRKESDELVRRFYPFDSLTETEKAMKLGINKPFKYKDFQDKIIAGEKAAAEIEQQKRRMTIQEWIG